MYCTHCGKPISAEANYCSVCGGAQPGVVNRPRLARPLQGRRIAGVCIGIANHLNVDVALVRIVFLVTALLPPSAGLIGYVIGWIAIDGEQAPTPAVVPAVIPPQDRGNAEARL